MPCGTDGQTCIYVAYENVTTWNRGRNHLLLPRVTLWSDERNRGKCPLGVVEELYPGWDGVVRAVKVRAGKTFLEWAVNHLYPLELSCDKAQSKPDSKQLNPDAPSFRPARDAAIAARQCIQDVAELERSHGHLVNYMWLFCYYIVWILIILILSLIQSPKNKHIPMRYMGGECRRLGHFCQHVSHECDR